MLVFWKYLPEFYMRRPTAQYMLADARRLLLCVCVTAMLEAAYETLFALYCLRVIDVTLYLWGQWSYLFT